MKRFFLIVFLLVSAFAISKLFSSDNIVIIKKNGESLEVPVSEIKSISHDYGKGETHVKYNNGSIAVLKIDDIEVIEFPEYSDKDISTSIESISNFFSDHNFYSDAVNDLEIVRSLKGVTEATANDGVIYVNLGNNIHLSKSYIDTEYYDTENVSGTALLQSLSYGNSEISESDAHINASKVSGSKPEQCLNKSVLLINAFANDTKSWERRYKKEIEELANIFRENQFKVKVIDGDDVTADTYLKEMPKYGITFILAHGENDKGTHYIQTGKKHNLHDAIFTLDEYYFMETPNKIRFQTIRENKLNKMNNFKDPNSIVFHMSCEMLDGNDNVWQIMKRKGLGGYYGYHGVNGKSGKVGIEGALRQAKELAISLTGGSSTYDAYNALQWRTDFKIRTIDKKDSIESRSMFLEYKGHNIIFRQDSEKWLKMTFDMTKKPNVPKYIWPHLLGLQDTKINSISGASDTGGGTPCFQVDSLGIVTITYTGTIGTVTGFKNSSILSFECNDTIKYIDSECFFNSSLSVFNSAAVEKIGRSAFRFIPIKRLNLKGVKTIHINAICSCDSLEYVSISGDYNYSEGEIISKCDNLKEVKFDGIKLFMVNEWRERPLKNLLPYLKVYAPWHNPSCEECGEHEHINAPVVYIPYPYITEELDYINETLGSLDVEFFKMLYIGNGHKTDCSHYEQRVFEYKPEH